MSVQSAACGARCRHANRCARGRRHRPALQCTGRNLCAARGDGHDGAIACGYRVRRLRAPRLRPSPDARANPGTGHPRPARRGSGDRCGSRRAVRLLPHPFRDPAATRSLASTGHPVRGGRRVAAEPPWRAATAARMAHTMASHTKDRREPRGDREVGRVRPPETNASSLPRSARPRRGAQCAGPTPTECSIRRDIAGRQPQASPAGVVSPSGPSRNQRTPAGRGPPRSRRPPSLPRVVRSGT